MNVKKGYAIWSQQYDTNDNKTRDLEAVSLRDILSAISFKQCLELGCGTGKNTEWLVTKAEQVTAVDFSEEMMAIAQQKIKAANVVFQQANLLTPWAFAEKQKYDLLVFSLVLEHIENLAPIFDKMEAVIQTGGYVYIGELHPFKQYAGSKARFNNAQGEEEILDCYNHHLSDFVQLAHQHDYEIVTLKEWFDDNDRNNIPRILAMLLKKN